jgi:hypothetical protein
MKDLSSADQLIFGLLHATLLFVLAYWLVGFDRQFSEGFAAEDGPVEYGTAVLLLLSALVLMGQAVRVLRSGRPVKSALLALYGLAFVFGAGEEVSWGQRLFGIETPEFFQERNAQGEITIHNLNWGEDHIAHTIFGNFLSIVLLTYLVVLPLLYPRVRFVAALANWFMVPVGAPRHAVGALLGAAVMMVVDLPRQWETFELVFALLALSIFLAPENAAQLGLRARREARSSTAE